MEEKEQVPIKETLPLVFRFEDEEPLPLEKEEWEKEVDYLFADMDMHILLDDDTDNSDEEEGDPDDGVISEEEEAFRLGLPGIRDTVIHLKPTGLQRKFLKIIPLNPRTLYEQNLVSLISVHPLLVAKRKEFSHLVSLLRERGCQLDPDIGVKMKFVIELIKLCGGQKERVIIFSQLLNPLNLIKEQLNFLFGWTLGREILHMDGKLDVKQRQISINSLNDPKSDVKVLLASTQDCSEGISLIGASRVVLLDVLWTPSVKQQAISRVYRNGQTKFVHVYCPVTKWEVDKIEQLRRERNHAVKMDPSCSVSEDNILESMVKHEGLRDIFGELPPTTCFNSCSQPLKPSS